MYPPPPPCHHFHQSFASTWNLAGCDCAQKSNTFQSYRGVGGVEEPIVGLIRSLLLATMENKQKKTFESRLGMGGEANTNWPQVDFRWFRCCFPSNWTSTPTSSKINLIFPEAQPGKIQANWRRAEILERVKKTISELKVGDLTLDLVLSSVYKRVWPV